MGVAAMLVLWQNLFNNILFPRPLEASYESWLQLAKWIKSICFKMWTRTDDDNDIVSLNLMRQSLML